MNSQIENVVDRVSQIILGKKEEIRLALACIFAQGHLLIEDIPGIGKTTMAKVMAKCMGLDFRRIQFTSDMLPGDILGVSVFEQKTGNFVFHPGPIFTQVLLSDEINRATPKTQSALLEAMEERQVTIEGNTSPLKRPFFVMATQNPVEQSGTFPLPENQLDRFLMRISIGYPDRQAEKKILMGEGSDRQLAMMSPCMTEEEVIQIQKKVQNVHASDPLIDYIQDILAFTRTSSHFFLGLSPRAGIALLSATRSWACLMGREYALPEDLQKVLPWVVGHRLRWKEDAGQIPQKRLVSILSKVPIP